MIIIRPKTIGDSQLAESNIVEVAPSAYNGGTTYDEGDQVAVLTGTTAALYESLQDGNTGHTPSSSPDWWAPIGTTYSNYNGGTSYSEGDKVIDPTGHRIYESLADANSGNPLTDLSKWLDIGPTNKWAMFDTVVGTATTHPTAIDVTLEPSGRIDSLALLNVANASTVQIIVSTLADGTLYDETFNMASTEGVVDWYSYFFEEIEQRSVLFVTGLPVYGNPTVRVIITGTNVQCGILVLGLSKYLGATQHNGASIGMIDYSRKEADQFGNITIVERPYANRGSFTMTVAKEAVDGIYKTLIEFRATPAVYVAAEEYGSTIFYGFFRDFSIEIAYPTVSLCSIEIEGLT